jgi:predicted Zn-dependent protease
VIPAQEVVERALQAAAASGRCDETIVIVTDRTEAALRWAGNSMTTNGVSTNRSTAVISIVRQGGSARVGVQRSNAVDAGAIADLVAAAEYAAHTAPEAGDSAALLTGSGEPADWGDPIPGTGAGAFAEVARDLSAGFGRTDRLYGFAHHVVSTTFLGTSTGVRRRFTQPTGSVEINAKRDGATCAEHFHRCHHGW